MPESRKQINHTGLLNLMRLLDYPVGAGLCYGYAYMAMQAFLQGEYGVFSKRLEDLYVDIRAMVEAISEELQKNIEWHQRLDSEFLQNDISKHFPKACQYEEFKALFQKKFFDKDYSNTSTKEDKSQNSYPAFLGWVSSLLHKRFYGSVHLNEGFRSEFQSDYRAFLDSIMLIQAPMNYKDLFLRFYCQPEHPGKYIISSKKLEDNNEFVERVISFYGLYEKSDLEKYLKLLKNYLKQNYSLFLASSNHGIVLNYNTKTQGFYLVDVNDFELNHSQEFIQIPESIIAAFKAGRVGSDIAIFSTTMFCLKSQKNNLIESYGKLTQSNEWKCLHDIENKNVNQQDAWGGTLLYKACENGEVNFVKSLLEQNDIKLNLADNDDRTPLYIACQSGYVKVVELLLQHRGIDVNKVASDGVTPLYIACQLGHVKVVDLLLQHHGIDVNKSTSDGAIPLHIACKNSHVKVVDLLLQHHGIDVNKSTSNGAMSLHIACQLGHVKVVDLLLHHHGIDVNKSTSDGEMPLHIACQNGHVKVVDLLLQHRGIDVNKAISNGVTPLLLACYQGNIEIVSHLLNRTDIDPNQAKSDGVTPLLAACYQGNIKIVSHLLNRVDIDSNQAKNNGVTPLFMACYQGNTEMIQLLLSQKDIRLNCVTNDCMSPLLASIFGGHIEIAYLLLGRAEIDLNQSTMKGWNPLYMACFQGYTKLACFLISRKGINPNNSVDDGTFPLMIVSFFNSKEVVLALLQHPDTDVFLKSQRGETAFELAKSESKDILKDCQSKIDAFKNSSGHIEDVIEAIKSYGCILQYSEKYKNNAELRRLALIFDKDEREKSCDDYLVRINQKRAQSRLSLFSEIDRQQDPLIESSFFEHSLLCMVND